MQLRILCACLIAGGLGAQTTTTQTPSRDLGLVGDRFKPLTYPELTPEQKTMVEHLLSGERKGMGGPFNVLLRSPEMGDLAQQFGAAMRFHAAMPRQVAETVIIMTGRYWTAQYEWNAHKAAALQAGVNPAIVDAIAIGKRPMGLAPDMEAAYNFIDELLTTHQVSDATFKIAKEKFGEKGVVDLMGLSGWYSIVSMALDVDRYPLAKGVTPELKPMETPLPIAAPTGFATAPAPGTAVTVKSTVAGKTLELRGDRFKPLTYEEMSPEQKTMAEHALAGRGAIGMFNVASRSPEMGDLLFSWGDRIRFHMSIPDRLKELAILITGRYWTTQFEWAVHHTAAVQAGLSEATVSAIAEGRRPSSMQPDEEVVYNFLTELFKTKQVSDAVFEAAKSRVGERGVVDLIGTSGYYQVVSMFMNVDRYPMSSAAQKAELKPLAKPLP